MASGIAIVGAQQLGGVTPRGGHAIAELFMLHSLGYPVFANPPVWSLYVEIIFYLVASLFIIANARQAVIAAATCLILFSITDAAGPREFELWKYFAAGILASEFQRVFRPRVSEWQATLVLIAGAIWLGFDIVGRGWLDIYVRRGSLLFWPAGRVTSYTLDLAVASGLILAGAILSQRAGRIAAWTPLRIFGTISFSLYVWHSMLIMAEAPVVFDGAGSVIASPSSGVAPPEWFRVLVMLPAFLGVAAVSFVVIERPFLALRRRRVSTSAAAAVSV